MKGLFLESNNKEVLNEFDIVKKFKSHNVIKERVDLYKDFSYNLLHYIYDTYLGKEYIKTKEDITGHFNWCFNKVLDEFCEEEINFYGNTDIYEYFFGYYYGQFYSANQPQPVSHHEKLWDEIFDYNKPNKSKRNFEILLEIYNLFDKSLIEKQKDVQVI